MTNCSPKKDPVDQTLTFTYPQCPPPETGTSAQITLEFDYIEPYWFEVRPPNNSRKTIQNGRKQEKLKKTTVQVPNLDNPENADGDNVNFIQKVYYQPEYEIITNNDEEVTTRPVYRRYCKADVTYDEQYFYHIFEWPTSHTLPPRPAGGITVTVPPPPPPSPDGSGTVSCPIYAVEQTSVSGTFNLAKVDSAVENVPEGTIIYHGGTDDNKIFFFYENTSNKDFIAVGDVINGWTVQKIVNYNSEYANERSIRTTESVRRRVSKLSDKNATPSFIYVNKNDVDETEDREILVGDKVEGYGIQPNTKVTAVDGLKISLSKPLKYKKRRKVRNVTFSRTTLINNVTDEILCYAEISGGSAAFVKDQFYAKSTPSTPAYNSFVYHVFDDANNVNLQLSSSKDIEVVPQSSSDAGGSDNSDSRKHYLVTFLDGTTISSNTDVSITITDNQTASGVSGSSSVAKIERVNSSSFKVWFRYDSNNVNTFVRGWRVEKDPSLASILSNRIQVVAGKGIIDRSAVCGVYVSNDKKFYSYTPVFYKRDSFCNPTPLKDELGEYLLGSILLDDKSYYIQQKFLCVKPLTDSAYQINNIFWTYFKRPAEQTELANWVSKLTSANFIQIQKQILDSEQSKLGSKKVLYVKDSECDNIITSDYTKVYYPHAEFDVFNEYLNPVKNNSQFDDCVDVKTPRSYTKNELDSIITSNLEGSFNFSSINLPQEMYKRIISNEDSLQNLLLKAVDSIGASVPKQTTIPNLPPLLEGEDNSGKIFTTSSAFRIPPRFKSLEYIIEDFSFVSDASLDPESEENKITIKLKSIPRWTGDATFTPLDGLDIVTNKDSNNFITNVTVVAVPFTVVPLGGSTKSWAAGPKPDFIWRGDDYNYQVTFDKILNFRVSEVTKSIANAVKNKGNPFMDQPPYAKLVQELRPSDTIIRVDDTSQFTSSGYIIIPKFTIKKHINPETKNETLKHYYMGEEIIYYKDKTETEFLGCTRQMFNTTYTFEETVNTGFIEEGITYIIKSLGSVNWSDYGAPSGYAVGTVFTAIKDGSGSTESGEVYLFGSTMDPFNGNDYNIHSYEKNNYISQYWSIEIQNKNVL